MAKSNYRLFSSKEDNIKRLSLFSDDVVNDAEEIRSVICQDCGYELKTAASTTDINCPKCGGIRFNQEPAQRLSLFSDMKAFSGDPENEFEEMLKLWSGKEITDEDVEKIFSVSSEDFRSQGYADITETGVRVFSNALLTEKVFAKLTITVTKELDLDPIEGPRRGEVINALSDRGEISPRGIALLKKAHSIPVVRESEFSETLDWIKDSGISGDLKLELGGTEMTLQEFKAYIAENYEDAPEDLIDSLASKEIITVKGDIVNVFK